ncbi:hypothetical protein A9Q83_04215 [Alphaproteobacteria bacterium 46_93_T64]|nr:hypothetical protein A9Q83_04215 [Alphaproteobacteria bacterium 46_93_T64]
METQTMELKFSGLKAKQRGIRDTFPTDHGLRIHRALSWLNRAELAGEDYDASFIFYWISFNSAYAEDAVGAVSGSERSAFDGYFQKIISLDNDQLIYSAIWQKFSASIRLLLNNKYVFQPFWNHHNQLDGYSDWEARFEKSKYKTKIAMQERDTKIILTTLFDRLYVLRNQLVHGGATWNSSVNRDQVRDGSRILGFLIPLFVDLMMDNSKLNWGAPYYPVVE